LSGVYGFGETGRHRDYVLIDGRADESVHAVPPSGRTALTRIAFLFVSLVAVVLLAKRLSPAVERTVLRLGAPEAAVGIV
ncbi:ionic transporter y4hA, partial [Burkholderia pseudomallei]